MRRRRTWPEEGRRIPMLARLSKAGGREINLDKRVRMVALAEMLSRRLDFDMLLLSELWLQKDHELIRQKVA